MNDRNLVEYLPPFLAEFKEINVALTAENPEFKIAWDAADRVLRNEFIETADEYGIVRFEKMLNIFPSAEDTLESRRARVQMKWFVALPYTVRTLATKLISLCGEKNFSIISEFDSYRITVETGFELFGQTEELENLLDTMIPCNMIVNSFNRISSVSSGGVYVGGVVGQTFGFEIGVELDENRVLDSNIIFAVCLSNHKSVIIDTA